MVDLDFWKERLEQCTKTELITIIFCSIAILEKKDPKHEWRDWRILW